MHPELSRRRRARTDAIRVRITHYRIGARIRRRSAARNGLEKSKALPPGEPTRAIRSGEAERGRGPALRTCNG